MPKTPFRLKVPAQLNSLRTEISGNSFLFAEGCSGISECKDDLIKIKADKMLITVIGKKLELIRMDCGCAAVKGKIKTLNYEEVGE